ncbi:DNA alkylation damage repair protein, partial [Caligus rogercresseyi]
MGVPFPLQIPAPLGDPSATTITGTQRSRLNPRGCMAAGPRRTLRILQHQFKAQASIVNFYPPQSTLSAHTDHSEP